MKTFTWRSTLCLALLTSTLTALPLPAHADPTPEGAPAAAPKRAANPYVVKLREGDSAFLARDYAGAAAIYSEAIKLEPRNALGHLRLGEALRAEQQYDAAIDAFGAASRFATTLAERAKAIFLQADTEERATHLTQAKSSWTSYQQTAAEHATQVTQKQAGASKDDALYNDTAVERVKQIDANATRTEQYAAVKARIEKRDAEISAKARADAAKQK
ncbi:MAG TPA: hypothetical protein VHM70_02070 [Polyangiaceae bacterium]|jgi:tetratricopeptide (TPR) repeat protein|nr:hypothetical protein [Polyangiaceae bacterium]